MAIYLEHMDWEVAYIGKKCSRENMKMAKNYVRCIKIVHHPLEVWRYRVLSAFFRFVGIFACENLCDDEYGDDVDYIYIIKEGSEEADVPMVKWIQEALNEMKEIFGEGAYEVLGRIAEFFSDNDLMRGSYAIAYFGDTGKEFIYHRMEFALEGFKNALKELEALEQEPEYVSDRLYIWAAKSNCKRRINEIFTIIWNAIENGKYGKDEEEKKKLRKALKTNNHYFGLDEVKEDISKILEEEPAFYGAYAILGFVAEIDDYHDMEAGDAFKHAVQLIGNKSYASYLLFRMGRYQNNIYLNLDDKMEYYWKAYKADYHNFRAGYKLAVNEQDFGNYREAFELWYRLLEVLEPKRELPSLQPVECAYLYKTYRNIGNLHNRQGEYSKAIMYLQKAEKVYNNESNEDPSRGFYPWMFGTQKDAVCGSGKVERWKVYKQAAREKLEIGETYADIVYASGRGNRDKIYDHYLAMA